MLMGDGEGVGLVMTDTNKFFLTNLRFFINLYYFEQFLRQCDFLKLLLIQNELIFNLWMKWMGPVFENTFSYGK